jgi:ankyrin repeat protein
MHLLWKPPDDLDPAILRALLAHPVFDANAQDRFGRTPLHYAASSGQIERVKLLLAHPGIELEPVDYQGRTPLCQAAEAGHAVVVRIFLDILGPAVWDATPIDKSLLAAAAAAGKVNIVHVLLESQYRVPRDVVHHEMGKAERTLAENEATLADWRRGVWDERAAPWLESEEFRTRMLESVEEGLCILNEMIWIMSMNLGQVKEKQE